MFKTPTVLKKTIFHKKIAFKKSNYEVCVWGEGTLCLCLCLSIFQGRDAYCSLVFLERKEGVFILVCSAVKCIVRMQRVPP